MKDTFAHLSEEKRERVIGAAVREFGRHGFEKGSTDRIIKMARISKGGLYEYIESKEDLYLFTLDHIYTELYNHIEEGACRKGASLPKDMLERLRLAAEEAVDYYIARPEAVSLIVKAAQVYDGPLLGRLHAIFREHFNKLFGDVDDTSYACERGRLFDLASWILQKTRLDFLRDFHKGDEEDRIRRTYLENWEFYLSVLKQGIYTQRRHDA